MPYQIPWLIFLLPMCSLLIIAFVLRPFFNHRPRLGGYVTIGAIGIACALSFWVLLEVFTTPGHKLAIPDIHWVLIGDLNIHIGLLIDSLSAVMLVVVTIISLMVQIYSQGYMKGEDRKSVV